MCCGLKLQRQLGTHGQMPEALDSWLSPLLRFQSVGSQAVAAASGQVRGQANRAHCISFSFSEKQKEFLNSKRRRLPTYFFSLARKTFFFFNPSRIRFIFQNLKAFFFFFQEIDASHSNCSPFTAASPGRLLDIHISGYTTPKLPAQSLHLKRMLRGSV